MTTIYRPDLDLVQEGGSIIIVDGDGNVRQTIGTQSDGTITTTEQNAPSPPAPSTPIVTPLQIGLSILWDGNLTDVTPLDFDHVEVHTSLTSGFTPDATTLQGTLRKIGSLPVVPLVAGTTYYAALVAVNTSSEASVGSSQASGVPTEVVADDIADGIVTTLKLADDAVTNAKIANVAVDTAQLADGSVNAAKILDNSVTPTEINFTARTIGGVTTTIASSAPGSPVTADIWIDTANGNRINRWSGTAWVQVQFGTNAITANSITAALIAANTITAGQIAANTITASQIAADTITAAQIAASAITASELAANSVIAGKIAAGVVDATAIAANTITAAKIAANTITASQIAANTITAGQIAASTISADKLAATLLLASTIIAGTSGGARVQFDNTGINAYDGVHPDPTVSITQFGNATFSGSYVSASSLIASSLEIDAGPSGAMVMYGVTGSPVNANPNFTANITNWSADPANPGISLSYSSTHTWNGHNTLRIVGTGPSPIYVDSELFTVIAGDTYTVDVTGLCEAGMDCQVTLRLTDSTGGTVYSSSSQFLPTPRGQFESVSFSVGGAPSAVKGQISFAISGGTNAVYIGRAGATLVDPIQVASLAPAAGTDVNGNAFPAGLAVKGAIHANSITAANIKNGGGTFTVSGTQGFITFTNPFGISAAVFLTQINDNNNLYALQLHGVSTTTVTYVVVNTSNGAVAGSGQTVAMNWIGYLPVA